MKGGKTGKVEAPMTRAVIARIFGVTGPAVTAWHKRGCPRRSDGRYDLAAVGRWLREGAMNVHRIPQGALLEIIRGAATKPTLLRLEREENMPRNGDRTYDLTAVVPWLIARLRAEVDEARRRIREGRDLHRQRREAAEAELKEIELARERGRLLRRDSVVAGWAARFQAFKRALLSWAKRLGERGLTRQQQCDVDADLREILRRLAAGQVELQLSAPMAAILGAALEADRLDVLRGETAERIARVLGRAVERRAAMAKAADSSERDLAA